MLTSRNVPGTRYTPKRFLSFYRNVRRKIAWRVWPRRLLDAPLATARARSDTRSRTLRRRLRSS